MYAIRILIALVLAGSSYLQTVVYAQDELTGMFRLSHTTSEVVGAQMAQQLDSVISVDEQLQWQVYVPESYQSDAPPGIFVFVDPNGWGGIPDQWRQTFDSHNLIWIGARSSANRATPIKQVWSSILAARVIDQQYAVDLNRMYIGGSGSGAGTAVNVMISSNDFAGAVYIGGSLHWGDSQLPQLENLRRKHHVFITGSNDKAKTAVRRDYDNYKKDGVENVKLIFKMKARNGIPDPEIIDEAIRYLDSR